MKLLAVLVAAMLVLAVAGYAALELSPWPAALVYRVFMDRGGDKLSRGLAKHVPAGIATIADERYDANDVDALLDVHYPAKASGPLPTVVWVHGGGWVSGSKNQVGNYLKILAARGFTAVGVDYSLAPASTYPTPVRQTNAALAYLVRNAARLHVDPDLLFLAGDSAGAQIVAQVANSVSVPSYAKAIGVAPSITRAQLRGVILYCGPYEARVSKAQGWFGHFVRTLMWSYSGSRDAAAEKLGPEFSVTGFITRDFPPAFISAGNGDPLLPQSYALARALAGHGARVDALFFPENMRPALPHEYQFDLDTAAGQQALVRSLGFLSAAAR